MNELKCPQCGGNKLQVMGQNVYKCMYCGNVINDQPKQAQQVNQQPVYQQPQPVYQQPQPVYQPQPQTVYVQQQRQRRHNRNKTTAAILALFLGSVGAQEFYLGNTFWGLICLCFCWTGFPTFWGFVDFVILLCKDEESFDEEYNY